VQRIPSVAVDDSGYFVIVWEGLNQSGNDCEVYAQRFGFDGNKIGGEFQVNTYYTEDYQHESSIAMDDSGNFVIAWQSLDQDGYGYGVYAQKFDREGNKIGDEFKSQHIY
jgi:hypothetical protein